MLRFHEPRKYVNKIKKRRAHGCTTKQLGLLSTGREMHPLTRKKNCFNFMGTCQMYVHVSWLVFQVCLCCPTRVCSSGPYKSHNALSTVGNSLSIHQEMENFLLGLIPNRYINIRTTSLCSHFIIKNLQKLKWCN